LFAPPTRHVHHPYIYPQFPNSTSIAEFCFSVVFPNLLSYPRVQHQWSRTGIASALLIGHTFRWLLYSNHAAANPSRSQYRFERGRPWIPACDTTFGNCAAMQNLPGSEDFGIDLPERCVEAKTGVTSPHYLVASYCNTNYLRCGLRAEIRGVRIDVLGCQS
jgi:hypothetical protein